MIIAATRQNQEHAEQTQNLLLAAGIDAWIEYKPMGTRFQPMSGYYCVCVHDKDGPAVDEVLLSPEECLMSTATMFKCPQCGSQEVDYDSYSYRSILTKVIFAIFPFWGQKRFFCKQCRNSWE